jgi:muconate cycloisomerase
MKIERIETTVVQRCPVCRPRISQSIVTAIRERVGADVNMFPDINRGYRNARTAIASVRAMCDAAGICAVEQPVEGFELMRRVAGGVFYTDDIVREPFVYADGFLEVPDRPGLGVELDREKLARYRVA